MSLARIFEIGQYRDSVIQSKVFCKQVVKIVEVRSGSGSGA